MDTNINTLRKLIEESRNIVFFGGAGVSTESGLRDYRSKDGIYASVKEYGVPPEIILSHDFFFKKPTVFFDFYYRFFNCPGVKPNAAHYALAKLESEGKLTAVITQNIDGLHEKAGSKKVLALHGTTAHNHCVHCNREVLADEVFSLGGKVPLCPKCGGLIKPDVVLYGEPLDEEVTEKAVEAIRLADLLIVGGTSLAVYPAAGLLQYFTGQNLVLINKSETPYDDRANLVIRQSIGKVLSAVV